MFRIVNWLVASATLAVVSLVAQTHPRLGAFLLTLPIVSVLGIILNWQQSHDLTSASRFARETLVFVLLGLPFFVPLAFAERLGLGFWQALTVGLLVACLTIGAWLLIGKS